MAKYTEISIEYFQVRSRMLEMDAPDQFYSTPRRELLDICNGVGGEGSKLSDLLTEIYRGYQTSAAIHDTDYHFATRGKKRADKAFLENMRKEWAARWGMLRYVRPTSLHALLKINAAYRAVRAGGGKYYGAGAPKENP